MNVLVVAAHPDDECLGCGGTIAKLISEGHTVTLSFLGQGRPSDYPKPIECATRAANVLGIIESKHVISRGLPDNKFDTVPLLDIAHCVEADIDSVQPDTIFTHCASDLNVDHRLTHQAVLTATRPFSGSGIREVYGFEVLSSTEWGLDVFRPTMFFEINSFIEQKVEALLCYTGETGMFPHPRSEGAVRALAGLRGSQSGLFAAEAFETIRRIWK